MVPDFILEYCILCRKLVLQFIVHRLFLSVQFFTTEPYACEPSSLPQYPTSKEMDAKLRDEAARRFVSLMLLAGFFHLKFPASLLLHFFSLFGIHFHHEFNCVYAL